MPNAPGGPRWGHYAARRPGPPARLAGGRPAAVPVEPEDTGRRPPVGRRNPPTSPRSRPMQKSKARRRAAKKRRKTTQNTTFKTLRKSSKSRFK